jgi:hypothetical protein
VDDCYNRHVVVSNLGLLFICKICEHSIHAHVLVKMCFLLRPIGEGDQELEKR